jgi:virginiamycin B lyase
MYLLAHENRNCPSYRILSLIAALALTLPGILPAQQIAIGDFPVNDNLNNIPTGITVGPDGALWYTETAYICRMTTAGETTCYFVPGTGGSPHSPKPTQITSGPDGALWFLVQGQTQLIAIGRITTAGAITQYSLPGAPKGIFVGTQGIVAGPDGALWFTESFANQIGRITTDGVISSYPVPTPNSGVWGITAGPDGALWFAEYMSSKIGRITTAGTVTEYSVPVLYLGPSGITAGPDGALWYSLCQGGIGRITTTGVATTYDQPDACPEGITTGPDGALWFADNYSKIGRITTDGAIAEYPVPRANSVPTDIITGPDGNLWFTELVNSATRNKDYQVGEIGAAFFVTAGLTVSPTSGYFHSNLTFTGGGYAPNETVQIYTSGVGSTVLVAATADASGSFTAMALAHLSQYGPRLFLGKGQSSGALGAANFSMKPRLLLSSNSGTAGSTVTATGCGFGAGEYVYFRWMSTGVTIGQTFPDDYGSFANATFTIPSGAAPGTYTVVALGTVTGATAAGTFTVN